jgi:hypothetical protein
MTPRNELEDWLTELPPLDGDEDEPDAGEGVADDVISEGDEDASLDDAAAEDLEVDEGIEITEEESANADDETWQADVGEPDLEVNEGEQTGPDADGPEAPSDDEGDLEVTDNLPSSDDDAGEEGTTDPVEHSLDEDLPALDADDEGDFEDALMLEVNTSMSPTSLRWADALWEERIAVLRTFAWPLPHDAIVAASVAHPPAPEAVAAVAEGAVFVLLPGETKVRASADVLRASAGERALLVGFAGSVLWVATRAGELAKSLDFGATWTRAAGLGRPAIALGAREEGSLSVLARNAETFELVTSSDGTRWFSQRVLGELGFDSAGAWIAHAGMAAAIGDAGGVSVSRDGRHFTRIAASAGATAGVFAGSAPDAPLILAGAFTEDGATELVRVTRDGDAEIVGELKSPGDDEEEPRVLALVWHAPSETLHVIFATHVAVWGPPKRS